MKNLGSYPLDRFGLDATAAYVASMSMSMKCEIFYIFKNLFNTHSKLLVEAFQAKPDEVAYEAGVVFGYSPRDLTILLLNLLAYPKSCTSSCVLNKTSSYSRLFTLTTRLPNCRYHFFMLPFFSILILLCTDS